MNELLPIMAPAAGCIAGIAIGIAWARAKLKKVPAPPPPPAPEPNIYGEHFFAEWDDQRVQPWTIYSTERLLDQSAETYSGVFCCWTKDDAIEIMRRLDAIVNARTVTATGSAPATLSLSDPAAS